jgi:hypothetical protein
MQAELSSTHTAGNQKFFEQIQSKLVVMHGQLLAMDAAKSGLPPGGAVDGDLANVVVLSVDIGSELISSFPEVLGECAKRPITACYFSDHLKVVPSEPCSSTCSYSQNLA